jgi:hypothetical protein
MAAADAESVKASLRQALEQALIDPENAAGLRLEYSRGHALSGVTTFDVDGSGRYDLESNETIGRKAVAYSGTLGEDERLALIQSMLEHDLLATPSSTRNLADDEVPVILTLSSEPVFHELRIWDGDAKRDPEFHAFETALLELVRKLSDGTILTSPL